MTLKDEQIKFVSAAKKILKQQLSTNPETLLGYKNEIIIVYNSAITYCQKRYPTLSPNSQQSIIKFITYIRNKFSLCLENLNYKYQFTSDAFEIVNSEQVISTTVQGNNTYDSDEDNNFEDAFTDTESSETHSSNTDNSKNSSESNSSGSHSSGNNNSRNTDTDSNQDPNGSSSDRRDKNPNNFTMAEEAKQKFITYCTKTIPEFDGTAANLPRFIDSLELVEESVGIHLASAIKVIKTKLGGDSRSYITDEATIADISNKLKKEIKSESSKVLSSKIMGLKQGNRTPNDFIKEVESMTAQLKMAFLKEGMPVNLAESHSVENAVKSSVTNVTNPQIKTVMQSADFKNINEVSTKFLSVAIDQSNNKAQVFYQKKV